MLRTFTDSNFHHLSLLREEAALKEL